MPSALPTSIVNEITRNTSDAVSLVARNNKNYFIIVRRTICRGARGGDCFRAVAFRRNYFLSVSKRRMTKMRKMKLGRLSVGAIASVLFALALLVAQAVSAAHVARVARQSAVERAVDSLIDVRTFHEVAVSPDGSKVAWSESLLGRDKAPTGNYVVYVADLRSPSAAPRRVTAGVGTNNYAEHDIAWSPDSRRIAFLSDRDKPGQLELYVADAAGGRARKLTDLKGYLSTPGWSPDGRRLALLFTANASRVAGRTQPTAPDGGW